MTAIRDSLTPAYDMEQLQDLIDLEKERKMADGLNELQALMNHFKNQTPSSPAWYQSIDQVVGTLLQIEISRAADEASYDDLRASGGIAEAP